MAIMCLCELNQVTMLENTGVEQELVSDVLLPHLFDSFARSSGGITAAFPWVSALHKSGYRNTALTERIYRVKYLFYVKLNI